jgi:hypothetical protein
MMKVKRNREDQSGRVRILHRRGPFLTEALTFDAGKNRAIVVELEPTYLALRMAGCRQRVKLDYTKLWMLGIKLAAEDKRRQKIAERSAGKAPARRAVRRGMIGV